MGFSLGAKKLVWIYAAAFSLCGLSYFVGREFSNIYAAFCGVVILITYIISMKVISDGLKTKETDFWLVPVSYAFYVILLGVFYAIPVKLFELVGHIDPFSAVYFCVISLTSVGYGDFTPKTWGGEALAMSMAITGTMHMIIFISVLFDKLRKVD